MLLQEVIKLYQLNSVWLTTSPAPKDTYIAFISAKQSSDLNPTSTEF